MQTLIALFAFVAAQDLQTVNVGKSEAAPYRAAVAKYQEAKAAFDKGDIVGAHDIANTLVEDPRLEQKRRECKLKLQSSDSTWEQPTDYFPVFIRAQSRVAQGKKLGEGGDKAAALAKLQSAKKDAEESVGRGVPGSADLQKTIAELSIKYDDNSEDPAVIRRRQYDALVKLGMDFKDKKDYGSAKGKFEEAIKLDESLPEAKEKLADVNKLIAEDAAYATWKSGQGKGSFDDRIALCDKFLKDFPDGPHAGDVKNSLDKLVGEKLSNLEKEKKKREEEYRSRWDQLCRAAKYKDAIEFLERRDCPLDAAELKDKLGETRSKSDSDRDEGIEKFLNKLANVDGFTWFTTKSVESLDRDFTVPEDGQLINTHPSFPWCRDFLAAARELRAAGRDADPARVVEILKTKDLWSRSAQLAALGESPYFHALEIVVRDATDRRLSSLVAKAKSAGSDELKKLKEESAALLARLDELDAKLTQALSTQPDSGKAWRAANGAWPRDVAEMKKIPDDFPVDAAEIENAAKALVDWDAKDGVYGGSPQSALDRIDRDLQSLDRKIGRSLARDARRRLYTFIVVARSMKLFLDGKKLDDVAGQLTDAGDELRKMGGPIAEETAKYGPKVEQVFAALK